MAKLSNNRASADREATTQTPREKSELPLANSEPIDDSIDPENEVVGVKLLVIHVGICLCTFLVGLDFNLIATAVPVITSYFSSIDDVGWYGSAFYVALCSSQPLAGKTYTLFPKKIVYMIYLAVFELGNLVSALAPTSGALIAGRAVAGLGASGVFAGGFVIITTIIPLHKRAIWQGTMSSTFAVASIIGPVIGGALTQHVTWRWCFYLQLPVGGFAGLMILIFFHIRSSPKSQKMALKAKLESLDFFGFVLFAGGIAMLLLPLQFGGSQYPWKSSVVIGLFIGSGLTLIAFVLWQMRLQDQALIPPTLFVNRNVWLICLSAFFVNGPFQTIVYWLPIWFQAVLNATPTGSGLRYLPTVISDVLASFIGAGIIMQTGIWNPFLLFAEATVCLGAGLLSTLYPSISVGHWIGYQIFGGIGYSLASNVAHLGMQASLPKELVPIGATNLIAIISTSCAIFLSIGQAIFEHRLTVNLSEVAPETVSEILSVGATSIRSVVDAADLPRVVQAYSDSITDVFYIPAAAPVLSFLFVAACQWTRLKKTEKEKSKTEKDIESNSVVTDKV